VLAVAALGHALCHVATLVLPQVVVEAERDLRVASIGWVVALGPFLMGFGALPAGLLGDRFGARRVYGGYLLLLVVACAAAAAAPAIALFAPAAALVGLAASMHHPVGLAWIGEALPAARAQALGIHGFVGHFGSTLAPLLVLLLAQGVGWRNAYGVVATAAALLLVTLLLTRLTKGERDAAAEHGHGARRAVPWRLAFAAPVLVVMGAMVANGWVHQGFWSTWTSFVRAESGALPGHSAPGGGSLLPLAQRVAELVPPSWLARDAAGALQLPLVAAAGLLATFVCAFGSVGELFGARLARRGGGLATYAAMNVVSAIGLAGVACVRGPALLAAGALFAFCHFGTQPLENELIARRVDARVRGLAYGMKFVVSFGIGSLATDPAIDGWRQHGFPPVFLALAGLALGGAIVSVALARAAPRRT